jgi:hypothetical protein
MDRRAEGADGSERVIGIVVRGWYDRILFTPVGRTASQQRGLSMVNFEAAGEVTPPKGESELRPEDWGEWRTRWGKWRAWIFSLEWALRWLVYWLRGLAMFKLLELAGRLVVVVALVSWWFEREDRLENKHNQAWTLIMSARGAVTVAGRKNALQNLNRDRVGLVGLPLEGAALAGLVLDNASLLGSNSSNARFWDARLRSSEFGNSLFVTAAIQPEI